ncbi:MAG: adenylate/guanylate cyclase domain-containing protein [Hyphomonadaceae bacterium]
MTGPTAPAPSEAALPRRLATIVAIDAAGYSRQSEIDQETAVREITALGERIRASAETRGGRVFNTAGDGFMLEFPTAAAAVAAAEEVQAVDRVPLRIGVHVGEVHETPGHDLLGKGANVAARLMQLAQPGRIIVSGDVKKALPVEIAARLHRGGAVRLDKMRERVEVHQLDSPWQRPRAVPLRWALAGAGAAGLIVAAWFGAQALLQPGSHAIAILEFRAPDASLQGFTTGLADRLIGAVSAGDLQAVHTSAAAGEDRVAAAAEVGATFVLDGSVRPDGDDLLVSARLIDTRGNVALWSNEYRRVASEQNYMQEEIAFDVARILRCALVSLEPRAGVDAATLAVFMRACQRGGQGDVTSAEEGYQAAKQVTERAPRFSRGWSMRGRMAARMTELGLPSEETEAYAAEARDAAARARRLDRSNGESYLIEVTLLPLRDWRGRQAYITQALQAEPDLAAAHDAQASLYVEVGRARDSLHSLERAIAIEPLNGDYQFWLSFPLNAAGNYEAAQENNDRLYRIWPDSPGAWWGRLLTFTFSGEPAGALRMLDDIESAPEAMRQRLREPGLTRWRELASAFRSGDRSRIRRSALGLREVRPQFGSMAVGSALSIAGEVDAAFEVAEGYLRVAEDTSSLFLPSWRNVRRDLRFMDLIKDTGLIQYWRETGRWPDFCAERDLPYSCEQEAARVLPEA